MLLARQAAGGRDRGVVTRADSLRDEVIALSIVCDKIENEAT